MKNDKILGVIYPLSEEIIDRILLDKKDIFIKYPVHDLTKKSKIQLKEGIKLFLYKTKSKKDNKAPRLVCGEALIKKINYMFPNEILLKYSNRLMLRKDELKAYSKEREQKKLLVLQISNIRRYMKPKKIKKVIAMNSLFVTLKNKEELFNQN
jgi:hypothetical protein